MESLELIKLRSSIPGMREPQPGLACVVDD
jgi:hypothetical protein